MEHFDPVPVSTGPAGTGSRTRNSPPLCSAACSPYERKARTLPQRRPGRHERDPHPRRGRQRLPDDAPGTVWFAVASDFEYFGDPDKAARTRRDDGNISTVGYLDPDAYLFLTDRKAHMISGGVNIYPQETERLVVTRPLAVDAAVIGVPSEDLGEGVKAVVRTPDGIIGDDALDQELIGFCRDQLAHFKGPRSIDFDHKPPRLPTRKLSKGILRHTYWADRGTRNV